MRVHAQSQGQPHQPASFDFMRPRAREQSAGRTLYLQRTPDGFAHDLSRVPVRSGAPARLQAKLKVGVPGDAYEQEADRVAERVSSAPEPQLQRASCGCGTCAKCQGEQDAGARLQTKSAGANDAGAVEAPPSVQEVLHSSGQPLEHSTRQFMESRMGQDFGHVRVHTDARAAESASEVNSLAYTVGRHVVFGSGQFAPQTSAGRRLLAHELAHVAQQGAGGNTLRRAPDDKIPCAVHAYDNSNPKDAAIVPTDGSGVGVSSVADMVSKVNAYVADPKNKCSCVNRLEINGHGTDGYQSVGNGSSYINNEKALVHDSTEEHLKQLASIKFCPTGLFMMIGCHVGQGKGKDLLHRISGILPGKLIGGAQHYTAPTMSGGPRVVGEGDKLDAGGNVSASTSDPYLTSRFVRWHLTIGDKEYVINGDEADTAEGKSKLKAADKIKVKTPDGQIKKIK